jgi:DNA-binding transcriptional MerR regulator
VDVKTGSGLTMAQVGALSGIPPDTMRYYERIGLVPPPARTTGDHRRYGAEVIDRLLFIRGAQRLGLHLAEIRELLEVRDTGVCACEPAEELLRRHLAEVDAELTRLAALRAELTTMLDKIPGPDCPDPVPGTWCPPTEPRKEMINDGRLLRRRDL